MIRARTVVAAAFLLLARTTDAQTIELSGLAGYIPAVEFSDHAREIDGAGIGGGTTFSIEGAWFFLPRLGVEASWSQQFTAYEIESGGNTLTVHDMSIFKAYGNVVYRFGEPDARLQPYLLGGIGTAVLTARDLPSESKLSFAFGGGVKYFRWPGIGLVGRFRFTPIRLNDTDAADFCDPFGYCQSTLRQIDVMGGVVLRF